MIAGLPNLYVDEIILRFFGVGFFLPYEILSFKGKAGLVQMRKDNKHAILLLVIMFVIALTSFVSGDSGNLSFKAKPGGDVRMDGNNIVWMSYNNGNWDIYHMDISTGVETQITHDSGTQGNPDVWQNYIVWQSNGENGSRNIDIYLYDMNSKQEKKISNIEGDHQDPIISNGKVVWVDTQNGERNIMLYDIKTETLDKVSSDGAQAFGISFDGQVISWMDARDGDFDIYLYDTSQKTEKQITYGLGDELDPLVSDGKVVWMVSHNGVSQVYMYETKNGYTTKLTAGRDNHRPIAFSGDSVLIIKDDKLVLNDVNRIVEQPIKSPSGTIPKQAFLYENKVIWYDGKGIVEEKVSDAVKRGLIAENDGQEPANPTPTPTPSPNNKHSASDKDDRDSSENDKQEVNGRILIRYDRDNIIGSQDGRMTMKIAAGTFDKDTYIIINQDSQFKGDGYLCLTPVYRWHIEGNVKPQKPIEISISYKNITLNHNPKKICLYEIQDNEIPKPITLKIDHQSNMLTSTVRDNGKAALIIYNKEFNDTEKHWASDVLEIIAAHHIINGYEDGSFKPDKDMTRAEFVKILISSLHINKEDIQAYDINFIDVPENYWASEYINIAYEKGWISGYNGKFNPNDTITREQMASILMRAYKDIAAYAESSSDDKPNLSDYKDKDKISPWALEAMKEAVELGIINGYNNELSPGRNATRAEAAVMLYRYLEKLGKM